MIDIWQGFFNVENDDGALTDVVAETGVYHGTGADINAEICISEQAVSDYINLKPDGQLTH